jgi:peptidoglycan hydrolase CwlO-like protein
MMIWHDKLNVLTTNDIRIKISYIENEIRETNKEIASLTGHRNSLKNELKEAKQKIDTSN